MLEIILGLCLIFLLLIFVVFLYCAIVVSKNAEQSLQRQIDIKDQYFALICAIGYDYNGCKNAKDLKDVIDKLVDLSIKGVLCDDKTTMGIGSNNKEFNILGEEKISNK